jgi:hypothetical protein
MLLLYTTTGSYKKALKLMQRKAYYTLYDGRKFTSAQRLISWLHELPRKRCGERRLQFFTIFGAFKALNIRIKIYLNFWWGGMVEGVCVRLLWRDGGTSCRK